MFLTHDFFPTGANAVARMVFRHQQEFLSRYQEDQETRLALYRGAFRAYQDVVRRRIACIAEHDSPGRRYLEEGFSRLNLVRFVVHTLAQVYRDPPRRRLVGPGAQSCQEALPTLLDELRWDETLREAERMVTLCNSVVLHLTMDPILAEPEFKLVPLSRVYVLQDPRRPNRIEASAGVAIELPPAIDHYRLQPLQYLRYTPQEQGGWRLDLTDQRGDILETYAGGDLPPLPVLPLVKIDAWRGEDFYPEGDDDLLWEALDFTLRITDFRLSQTYAAHPLAVLTGSDPEQTARLAVGPGTVLGLADRESSFEFVTPSIDWGNLWSSIIEDLKLWLLTRGVPPSELETKPQERSGVAKFQSRQSLYERRNDQLPLWRRAEADLWRMTAVLLEHWGRQRGRDPVTAVPVWSGLPWSCGELSVQFATPAPLLTERERLDLWKARIDLGLASMEDCRRAETGVEAGKEQ